jgi:hypothetical protein
MLANPPYGKSWSSEQKYIKDGKDIIDPRFQIKLKDYWGEEVYADTTPRSSNGQLLFLMEMVNKMKPLTQSPIGSRIASVHNGSNLFTLSGLYNFSGNLLRTLYGSSKVRLLRCFFISPCAFTVEKDPKDCNDS